MVLHLLSLVWSAFVAPSDKCRTFDENCLPEQVHIAFGDKINDIAITWSTMKDTHKSVVQFGEKTTDQMTTGHRTVFVDGGALKHKQWIHRATLMDLKYDTKYVYKVGSKYGMSKEFSFRTPPSGQDFVLNALVVGDMGIPEGEKVKTLAGLEYELKNSRYYMVIHNGDFAYEFYDENGMKGDRFMRMIEPVAANIPYMTTPGNHEDRYNFSHYKNRFTMPRHGHENMFYSFNIGLVHFVMANTEVYHIDAPEQQEKYPWIILMAHQPMYCSSTNKWDKCRKLDGTDADYPQRVGIPEFGGKGMEVLLKDYGVDLVICAHEHFFERSWPLYNKTVNNGTQGAYINPGAPPHVTTGAGGNDDGFYSDPKPWSAFRSRDYGYGRLRVFNRTHLYWDEMSTQHVTNRRSGAEWRPAKIDEFWLVRDEHKPYNI